MRRWLAARPRWWRAKVELVAIDMSAELRAAVRTSLPRAVITVDHCHVVARANQMITDVPRRRSQTLHGRRDRNSDPAYRYRKLLTCNQENLSVAQRGRLAEIIDADLELGVVWGIKEHVRPLLRATDTAGFQRAWAELEHAVKATRRPEAKSLFATLRAWRRPLLRFSAGPGSPTPAAKRRT